MFSEVKPFSIFLFFSDDIPFPNYVLRLYHCALFVCVFGSMWQGLKFKCYYFFSKDQYANAFLHDANMTFSVPLHKAVSVQKEPRPPLNSFEQHVFFCERRPLPYLVKSQFDISSACIIWFLSFATKRAWLVQP